MDQDQTTVIKVDHLVKSFKIPLEAHSGIKQKIINTIKGVKGYRTFTPLNGVSFDIKEGEFFGIVGRNGSGKSTLLKSIAGIYTPDGGGVHVNGKLVPFIELGVGFNPELTGRENVFLNGALLGFSNNEMETMYSEIVDFAELHDFMEEKLKNYSSGMQVRLAFSIAIRAEGDILLLDEVLAVGDEAFQRKCYEYFNQLKREGRTVVLVTHSMAAVESFCTRALFLEKGTIKVIGDTHKVASAYNKANNIPATSKQTKKAADVDDNIKTTLLGSDGKESTVFTSGEKATVRIEWEQEGVENVGVAIIGDDGKLVYATNTFIEGKAFRDIHSLDYKVTLNMGEGSYYVKVGLFGEHDQLKVAFNDDAAKIAINKVADDYNWQGVTQLDHEWEIKHV